MEEGKLQWSRQRVMKAAIHESRSLHNGHCRSYLNPCRLRHVVQGHRPIRELNLRPVLISEFPCNKFLGVNMGALLCSTTAHGEIENSC